MVQWPVAGQGATNLRSQPAETYLSAANAGSLIPKWIFTTSGDVSATPTVGTTAVFVPDWDGNLFAIDLATGSQLWSHQISEYDGYAGAVSRVSPALYDSSIIIGDSESTGAPHNGANVIAVNHSTGKILWSYATGGSVIDGPSIVSSNLFWGSGYHKIPPGTANNKVYDFTPAPAVTVTVPVNGSQIPSPVQFKASAASPNCAKGVASMRIYTAPGVDAYTVDSPSLITSINLSAGAYNTVVQSWDNCGNVGKTFVTITVTKTSSAM